MGLFLGGALGGWFNGRYGVTAVFLFCAVMAFSWFLVSLTMKQPRYLSNMLISLENVNEQTSSGFVSQLLAIAGVVEVTVHHEEAVAYLKVDSHLLDKDQLQNLIEQFTSV
jgi:MFS family permease